MARRKNLTREFDSAIDVDFLKKRILHDAFAKLAAEQDAYNQQMGYPANGTTGELPIQEAKYGGRQFQTGGTDYISLRGAGAINGVENSIGNPSGGSMGMDDNYAQGKTPKSYFRDDKAYQDYLNSVAKVQDYVHNTIGMDQWNQFPEELQTQAYSYMFNHGADDSVIKGLAHAINPDAVISANSQYSGDTDLARQNLTKEQALGIISKGDLKDPTQIYNRYVNQTLPMQYQSIADNYKGGFDAGQDIYDASWKYRPYAINQALNPEGAVITTPPETRMRDYWENKKDPIPPPSAGGGGTSPSSPPPGVNGKPPLPTSPPPSYKGNPDAYNSLKELEKYMANRSKYKPNTMDKITPYLAGATGLTSILAGLQSDKDFGKFHEYTPEKYNVKPALNALNNNITLNTNNVMNKLATQSGSSGNMMSNMIQAGTAGHQAIAEGTLGITDRAAQVNMQAENQAKQYNAQQRSLANDAKEKMRSARWNNIETGIGQLSDVAMQSAAQRRLNFNSDLAGEDSLATVRAYLGVNNKLPDDPYSPPRGGGNGGGSFKYGGYSSLHDLSSQNIEMMLSKLQKRK